MPKNVNYNLIALKQKATRDLRKQNAIINSIRRGNVTKAEILSGEELVRRDPVLEGLSRKEQRIENKKPNKVLEKLQVIADKPDFDIEKFLEGFKQVLQEERLKRGQLLQLGAEPDLFDSDEEREPIIEEPEDVIPIFPDVLPKEMYIGTGDNKQIYVQANIYNKDEIDQATDINRLEEHLVIYEADFFIYHERLLKGKRGQHFIKNQEEHNKNLENYRHYIDYFKWKISQLKQQQQGSSIMTTIEDLKERLEILIGEITSGNTSKVLKNELADILVYLYSKRKINKNKYEKFMDLVK